MFKGGALSKAPWAVGNRPSAMIIYTISLLLPILMGYVLWRVKREYQNLERLSWATSLSVWLLYLVHAFLTGWSAWLSLWPIPFDPVLASFIGIILVLAGFGFCAAGVVAFSSLSRMSGLKADQLITTGVYRWSRNPQNVGLGIALIGVALLGRSGFSLLLAGFFWLAFILYLPMEESYLRRVFGEPYARYCQRTPRYLGPSKSGA